jgi:hypothetical protein
MIKYNQSLENYVWLPVKTRRIGMSLDRKELIEALLHVMEIKIGTCTEEEARSVLQELEEKPYSLDIGTCWDSYVKSSF